MLFGTISRMRDAIIRALAISARQHRILEDGAFYAVPGAPCRVRNRSTARSTTLRLPESLPPEEISKALRICVGRSFGATEEQAVQAVSRAPGFKATSAQLRDVIAAVLERTSRPARVSTPLDWMHQSESNIAAKLGPPQRVIVPGSTAGIARALSPAGVALGGPFQQLLTRERLAPAY